MVVIAFIGSIQHDVEKDSIRRLVEAIKADAACDCIVTCNANGLFATASKLNEQLEILFDSGIDLVMVGEQAISRSCCRAVFAKAEWPVIKAINLPGSNNTNSIKQISHGDNTMWFISCADGSGKVPIDLPHLKLDEFFKNKKDNSAVIINESGSDLKYLKALAYRYSRFAYPVLILGSSTGEATRAEQLFSDKCLIQYDAGSVVTEKTICGIDPELWWKKSINRRPLTLLPKWGSLKCDYTLIWLSTEKIEKYCVKSVRI